MKVQVLLLAILGGVASATAQAPEELQAFRLEYRMEFDEQSAPVLGSDLAEALRAGAREIRQQVVFDAPGKRLTVRTFSVMAGAPGVTPLRDVQTAELENYRVDVRRVSTGPRSLVFEGVAAADPRVFLAPVIAGDSVKLQVFWYGVTAPVFNEVLIDYATRTAQFPGGAGMFEFSRTANRAPVAVIAPAPQQLFQPELRLDASGSSDPDGEALDYNWRAVRGSVSIQGGDTATPRIQFHSGPGTYELVLTVTDARGASAEASVSTSYYGR